MSDAILTPRMTLSLAHTKALAIVRDIEERNPVQSARMDAADLRRLLVEMFDETKAVLDYVDRQEKNIAEMVEGSNRREREITRLQRALLDAERTSERVMMELSKALDHVTAAFNDVRAMPRQLATARTGEFPRPMGVLGLSPAELIQRMTNQPPNAAKGA